MTSAETSATDRTAESNPPPPPAAKQMPLAVRLVAGAMRSAAKAAKPAPPAAGGAALAAVPPQGGLLRDPDVVVGVSRGLFNVAGSLGKDNKTIATILIVIAVGVLLIFGLTRVVGLLAPKAQQQPAVEKAQLPATPVAGAEISGSEREAAIEHERMRRQGLRAAG